MRKVQSPESSPDKIGVKVQSLLLAVLLFSFSAFSADLSTIDTSRPLGSELASTWDDYLRETRAAMVASFGLEHYLAGSHPTGFLATVHFSTNCIPVHALPDGQWLASTMFGTNSVPSYAFASNSVPIYALATGGTGAGSPAFCLTNIVAWTSDTITVAGGETVTLFEVPVPEQARFVFATWEGLNLWRNTTFYAMTNTVFGRKHLWPDGGNNTNVVSSWRTAAGGNNFAIQTTRAGTSTQYIKLTLTNLTVFVVY